MSCCGKKRKASDPARPTLASPIGLLKPRQARTSPPKTSSLNEPRPGGTGDARVTSS
jgi:hypothetical protein